MAPVSANATAPAVEAQGARIPLVGLGTWELRGRACARVVEQALRLGYRHIDTAEMYDNEREVGRGAARLRRQARGGVRDHENLAVAFRPARARTGGARTAWCGCA